MSNKQLIIEERSRNIGHFLVGCLLPFIEKRMVGPFIFIDHIGLMVLGPENYFDIDPHPHIGLSTLTYLFSGEIVYSHSTGAAQIIKPGFVNWISAGKLAVHAERTPRHLRNGKQSLLHGFQIWVALPKEMEEMEASFFHAEAQALPIWHQAGIEWKLIAGEYAQPRLPVPVHSALYMLELKAIEETWLPIDEFVGETALCVVKGNIESLGQIVSEGHMLVKNTNDNCKIKLSKACHLLVFGGKPLHEPRHIFWNFVSSDKDKIRSALAQWQNRMYPLVPNDTGYIPAPALPNEW